MSCPRRFDRVFAGKRELWLTTVLVLLAVVTACPAQDSGPVAAKALSSDWGYVQRDIQAVCDEAHRHGAKVKVIFENDYLTKGGAGLSSDDFKRRLCQICEQAGADWVKTSSGYGFVKQPDGSYSYKGATEHDLALMRASVSPRVQVKAAGGVRDLDGLIKVRDLGATRCGATATAAMLDTYRQRQQSSAPSSAPASIGTGGY